MLSERLQLAMREAGVSQAELARACSVKPPSVNGWLSGKSKFLRGENLLAAAKALGVSQNWLATGKGPMHTRQGDENTEPGPDILGRVPLISWVQAGAWSEIIDNLSPGDAEEWLPCPVSHSPATFVLRVRGESMLNPHGRPSFQDGDLIFVDPERPAEHGSLVVVRLDDAKEATFKKLVIEGERRYLRALNPAWPEPMIHINGNATICGTVIFKGEKL